MACAANVHAVWLRILVVPPYERYNEVALIHATREYFGCQMMGDGPVNSHDVVSYVAIICSIPFMNTVPSFFAESSFGRDRTQLSAFVMVNAVMDPFPFLFMRRQTVPASATNCFAQHLSLWSLPTGLKCVVAQERAQRKSIGLGHAAAITGEAPLLLETISQIPVIALHGTFDGSHLFQLAVGVHLSFAALVIRIH